MLNVIAIHWAPLESGVPVCRTAGDATPAMGAVTCPLCRAGVQAYLDALRAAVAPYERTVTPNDADLLSISGVCEATGISVSAGTTVP